MFKTLTAAILATSGQSPSPVAPAGKPCSGWVTIGTATEQAEPMGYTEIYRIEPDAADPLTCDLPMCIQVMPTRENETGCRAQDQ